MTKFKIDWQAMYDYMIIQNKHIIISNNRVYSLLYVINKLDKSTKKEKKARVKNIFSEMEKMEL